MNATQFSCANGHPSEPDAKFCATCGSPVAAATPPPTRHPRAKRHPAPIAIAGMLAVAAVATAAVRGGVEFPGSRTGTTGLVGGTTTTQTPVTGIPTAEVFGPAAWEIRFHENVGAEWDPLRPTTVRSGSTVWNGPTDQGIFVFPDRLLTVSFSRGEGVSHTAIRAYSAQGEEVWTKTATSDTPIIVWRSNETIGIRATNRVAGTGLDAGRDVETVQIVSVEDGSLVAEVEVSPNPGVNLVPGEPTGAPDAIAISLSAENTLVIAEDGASRIAAGDFNSIAGGVPFRFNNGSVSTEQWEFEFDGHRFLTGSRSSSRIVTGSNGQVSLIDISAPSWFGSILATAECAGESGREGASNVASPNGKFGVWQDVWYTSDQIKCFGGGEGQQRVALTAVTDDGTAFGMASEGGFVVVRPGEEPTVMPMPSGALPPIGIMSGDIAVHWEPATGVITGNPINDLSDLNNSSATPVIDANTTSGVSNASLAQTAIGNEFFINSNLEEYFQMVIRPDGSFTASSRWHNQAGPTEVVEGQLEFVAQHGELEYIYRVANSTGDWPAVGSDFALYLPGREWSGISQFRTRLCTLEGPPGSDIPYCQIPTTGDIDFWLLVDRSSGIPLRIWSNAQPTVPAALLRGF